MASQAMPLVSLINVFQAVLCYFVGCFKALGAQAKAVSISIFTSLAVKLPLALIFAYWLEQGIWGLILGFLGGIAAQMFILGWKTYFSIDWQEVADEVQLRI